MGQLRTANKRHKRVALAGQAAKALTKAAAVAPAPKKTPAPRKKAAA